MAKLFVISDCHGFFTELKKALDDVGFDPQNPQHWLIGCGDYLDRGREPQKVIDYLMSLPNKVLVKGNHESLLVEMINRQCPLYHDYSNGTAQTVVDLAPNTKEFSIACAVAYEKVRPMLDIMVNYFETENYIFCHSWVPGGKDWRYASQSKWNKAMWGNPFDIAAVIGNKTGKTIVHGHWHNSTGWWKKGIGSEFDEDACFDIIEHDGCIGLDACTAWTHKVNVFVVEDNFLED